MLRQLALIAAQAYVDSIALGVEQQTGIKRGPKAGRIDCDRLRAAAKIR